MYATDGQTKATLIAPFRTVGGIIIMYIVFYMYSVLNLLHLTKICYLNSELT